MKKNVCSCQMIVFIHKNCLVCRIWHRKYNFRMNSQICLKYQYLMIRCFMSTAFITQDTEMPPQVHLFAPAKQTPASHKYFRMLNYPIMHILPVSKSDVHKGYALVFFKRSVLQEESKIVCAELQGLKQVIFQTILKG